jgi:3-hydroxyacyl-CoA dehydrogenase / enoyl-CoA hydratase / 3-hydroxybutyryl-CoA epimerase
MSYFESPTIRVDVAGEGIRRLLIDLPDKSVNVLNGQVMADFHAALDRVAEDQTVKLLIVNSSKPSSFVAGADLHEFTRITSSEEASAMSARGQQLFDKLAALPIPTMAVIAGPCLGGGLELALACDYRVALDHPVTQFVFPEVELGLLPGWGGTQRAPRVVGLEHALEMILGAKRVNAQEALRWGLIDALAPSKEKLLDVIETQYLRVVLRGKAERGGLPGMTWRQRLLESNRLGRAVLFRAAEKQLAKRVPDDMPAPREALEAVRIGIKQGMQAGFQREREAAGRLAVTPACRNLVNLYFHREHARKSPGEQTPAIGRVGIVGAGVMGAGIAQLAAIKGCEIIVQEVDMTALGAGLMRIKDLFDKAVDRRLLTHQEAARRLEGVHGTTAFEGFDKVDLVIEAAIEEPEAKKAIFRELEKRTPPNALLATNTSSLSVAALQEGLTHPERVAGLHFFNPVHKMPLVEVVSAPATAERVARRLAAFAVSLGKTPVFVRDSPGFVVNRILMPYLGEAVLLAAQRMNAEAIDRAMRKFGMPMGPLELLDQIGLDVAAHVGRTMHSFSGDRFAPLAFHPTAVFEQMVRNGWLGQKNGKGFYVYRGKKKSAHHAALAFLPAALSNDSSQPLSALPAPTAMHEARERLVLAMVNEAAACLGENLTAAAADIDLAMIMGAGWAPHRGGPLRHADDRGLPSIVQTLGELEKRLGPRFAACAELRGRSDRGATFYPKTDPPLSPATG